MIKAGIVGSTGYVAGELIRSLLLHPNVEIDFCTVTRLMVKKCLIITLIYFQ